jgi:hypothetical protein
MEVITPRTANTIRIHGPRTNLFCSQTARHRKKTVGKITEKPNWPTHISRFSIFMGPPGDRNYPDCPYLFQIIISYIGGRCNAVKMTNNLPDFWRG